MKKVLFIENQQGTEHAFTRGFRIGCIRGGWKPSMIWIRDVANQLRPSNDILREIEDENPDFIIWIMDTALPISEALLSPSILSIPKASLWFDDFERAYSIHLHADGHRRLIREGSLTTCVWDGYWRKEFEKRFTIPCQPIHLAADPVYYHPGEPTHFKGFDDSVIFIGNIPSMTYIKKETEALPKPCRQLVEQTAEILAHSPYGRLPYDARDESLDSLPLKMKKIVKTFRSDPAQSILINRLVWMLAKRETRLRILRLTAQQRQLVVLSGHSDRSFVDVHELGHDIGPTHHPVKFVNTDHVSMDHLGCLYHIGGLHLQATDPQSVEGGIPFRVFETAASERPLLSDYKPELVECFKPDEEILCYQDDRDFPEKLSAAMQNPSRLREIAHAARQRFLKEHTWQHRFENLLSISQKNSTSQKAA